MVSTRSHSILSAGAAADTAATAGEVTSVAPTPRRSGRLARSSGGAAAAATPTAPRSARAIKNRRQLEAVKEAEEQQEAEQVQQEASQQEGQQPHAAHNEQQEADGQQGEQLSPRARRRSAAAAKAAVARSPATASQRGEAEGESEGAAVSAGEHAEDEPVLTADPALVDVLAEQMFAALEELTNQRRQGDSSSESGPDEEEERQQPSGGAAQQQQERQEEQQQDGDASSSDNDSSGSEDESDAGDSVPSHLRWQPELVLPGQAAGGSGSGTAAPASVHVVRRGNDGLHVPPPDERLRAKAARKERPDTAGKGWFDLPATQVTDEVKNDLRMLRLRGALDPKAHYKKLDTTKFPKYFQMGTVVESAADFYSGRLTNKQRKRTLTEEVMADAQLTQVRKKRFTKLQEERSYWSKKPAKKTSNERRKKAHRRPKH